MSKKIDEPTLKVCETCPWLKKNHGRPHSAKWYSIANIKRLWNGIRQGKAAGNTCHASDPDQAEYGGTAKIKPGVEARPCAGAILVLGQHINAINDKGYAGYRSSGHKLPVTKTCLLMLLERQVFGGNLPPVENRMDEVGLPWDNETKKGNEDAGIRS